MAMNVTLMKTIGVVHGALYRMTSGRVGAKLGGRPMVLLTTTGRKSGKPRTTPLLSMRDGDNIVVVASNGGNAPNPGWWHNLRSDPRATAQVGRKTMRVRADEATGDERARLWERLVEAYPGYSGYEEETERTIPVVVLRAEG